MSRIGNGIALLAGAFGLLGATGAAAADPRSAQGDCQREAQRRGYQVLDTGNFRQSSDGWRLDLRVRFRNGRIDTGTCFVQGSSGRVTLYGFEDGQGGGSGGSGAMRFRCESYDGRYHECQIPVDGVVERLPRLSDAPCNEGYSWGRRGDRVWVDRGCRSDFEVRPQGGSGGGSGGGSNSGQQQRAEVACRNQAQRQFITLTRINPAQYRGSYWQTTLYGTLRGQSIQGDCRFDPRSNEASIFIESGGGSGGGSIGGGSQTASRTCSDQARRLGYGVQQMAKPQAVSGGYRVGMTLTRGTDRFAANCTYRNSNGRAEIDQVLPQPR
jgi:hypothetical protein